MKPNRCENATEADAVFAAREHMASIVYSLSGEGRGHATRARTVVEALRGRHEVTVFASGLAHEMLAPRYRGTEVRVIRVAGLTFGYSGPGRIDLWRTLMLAGQFRWRLSEYVRTALPLLEAARPDLVVADFEPIIPRAAQQLGVPFVSLDHQHYLVVGDLSTLPIPLRFEARTIAPFVSALYDWQDQTIVSSFYKMPVRARYRDAVWTGTLIRPELAGVTPHEGRHVLTYLRRSASEATLNALAATGVETRVYGLGAQPARGALTFHEIDERRFLEDLATCRAVVSTAGNQLVGEAIYLRKPCLVQPEEKNFEQSVNAHFLEKSGAGWSHREPLTSALLGRFLDAASALRPRHRGDVEWGNEVVVAELERRLPGRRDAAPARVEASLPPLAGGQWA
jgi:uncharacterized protein (TIGR00661 family)